MLLEDMPDVHGDGVLVVKSAAVEELPVAVFVVDYKQDGKLVAVNRAA